QFPPTAGTSVTILWSGKAVVVRLRHWVYGLESSTALSRVPGTDLWYLTLEIPRASRVESKLEIHRGGTSEWVEDPLNPNRARDPFGANSVLQTEGYEPPLWTRPDPLARPGTLEPLSIESAALGRRGGAIYLPARFRRNRQYPLLVVHDGSDYLNYASMKTVLDNLIHSLAIPDLIVAFTDIGKRNRRGPLFDRVVEFVNAYRAEPRAVSERVFMSCGVYESLIYENRSMLPLLAATGMEVRLVESRDGHNWENWRDRLREGLSWLFPGPLSFIYE